MAGCGNSENTISGEVKDNPGSSIQGTGGSGGSHTGGSQGTQAKGYVFIYNGVTVSVDGDMAPILEAFGEPADYYEAASCAFEG